MKFVVEKLKQALLAVENFGGEALIWFDNIFPPETRGDTIYIWFQAALPWIIGAVVLMAVICCCRCCCQCCCGGGRGRMMKAPGRNCMMLRDVFESNRGRMMKAPGRNCMMPRDVFESNRGRMMKAPGRNCMMPRDVFESNPRGYFRNLRSYPGDQLC